MSVTTQAEFQRQMELPPVPLTTRWLRFQKWFLCDLAPTHKSRAMRLGYFVVADRCDLCGAWFDGQ